MRTTTVLFCSVLTGSLTGSLTPQAAYTGEGPGVIRPLRVSPIQAKIRISRILGIDLTRHAALGAQRAYLALEVATGSGPSVATGVYDFASDTYAATADAAAFNAATVRASSLSISPDLLVAVADGSGGLYVGTRASIGQPFANLRRVAGGPTYGVNPEITQFDGGYWLISTDRTTGWLWLHRLNPQAASAVRVRPVLRPSDLVSSRRVTGLTTARVLGDEGGSHSVEHLSLIVRGQWSGGAGVFFASRLDGRRPAHALFLPLPFQLGPGAAYGGRLFFGTWSGALLETDVIATNSATVPLAGGRAVVQTSTPPGAGTSTIGFVFGGLRSSGQSIPGLCGAPLSVYTTVVFSIPGNATGITPLVLQLPPHVPGSLPGQAIEVVPSSGRVCLGNTFWLQAK